MLLAQFVLIIVDRALYLRKQVIGKFFFHIFLVLLVHIWIFFVLPHITSRSADTKPSISSSIDDIFIILYRHISYMFILTHVTVNTEFISPSPTVGHI